MCNPKKTNCLFSLKWRSWWHGCVLWKCKTSCNVKPWRQLGLSLCVLGENSVYRKLLGERILFVCLFSACGSILKCVPGMSKTFRSANHPSAPYFVLSQWNETGSLCSKPHSGLRSWGMTPPPQSRAPASRSWEWSWDLKLELWSLLKPYITRNHVVLQPLFLLGPLWPA